MTEETFVRALERRADDVHGVPLSFEDVRGRARGIRRRRRAAVAAAAAMAVVAVALPSALLSGGSDDTTPDPAPAPAQGAGAAVLHAGVVTMPDGSTVPVEVDNRDVSSFGVLADGRIVIARSDRLGIQVLAPDGRLETEYAVDSTALVVSPTDEAAAWIDENDVVQVLETGADEPVALGSVPSGEILSFMVDAVTDDGRVLLGDGTTTSLEATADGVRELVTSEPLRVIDIDPEGSAWAVQYADEAADPQFGCSGIYDPGASRFTARNCDTSGLHFSPDGQHLLGMRGDNNMYGEVSTFDLDLQPVGTFAPEGRTVVVSRAGWADPTHLVVSVADWETSRWSLVRVGLEGGDPEVVVPEGPGGNPELVQEFLVSD